MSTPPMDPYKVLGVPMDAQLPDIRTAHRKLILKCHPDKVADPALKAQKQDEFQKVQQAYEVLSDEDQRQKCDDLLKLHQLRERMNNKANTSAPRASPQYREFEIRTAEPPRSSKPYRETTPREAPPNVKIFSYTRGSSREEERGPRYYPDDVRPLRRGESYSEKPSKRESERESQRDREKREEKERRKEKDRRKLEKERERDEENRRIAEKAAKKEAKKQREKQEAKEKKRDKEDKRRDRDTREAYIEPSDEEILHKKSSTRKYDTRERSSGRDEPPSPMRRVYTDGPQVGSSKINNARAYIHRSQTSGPPDRSNAYHPRDPQPPAAPTPPPAPSNSFPPPDEDDARRSSARPRRGSADVPPPMPRGERNIHRSSREPVDPDPVIVDASPAANRTRYTTAPISESPPRVARTNTMPTEKPSRAMPPRRSQTYSEGPEIAGNRGRGRSKMYSQAEVLSESEEDYDEPPRRSKHRSGRKERSPPQAQEIRYHVGGDGRTKLQSSSSYMRSLPQKQPTYANYDYDYEPARSTQTSRPEYARGASYSGFKVKQGRSYNVDDAAYSSYGAPAHAHYPEERSVYA